jgi:hypothetical protein
MMNFNELFDILDLDGDEKLSRKELHRAAKQLGWHWHEAPFFAVFDLLTLFGPISRKTFNSCLKQIVEDPLGPYGRVLLNGKYDLLHNQTGADLCLIHKSKREYIQPETQKKIFPSEDTRIPEFLTKQTNGLKSSGISKKLDSGVRRNDQKKPENQIIQILETSAGCDTANDYKMLLHTLEFPRVCLNDAVLLIIDPQRSFTKGAWMKSIGSQAQQDIKVIETAFKHGAQLLREYGNSIETMFSRCPFPPDSYDWDGHFKEIIDEAQPYFIKPGNSIMYPPTNGYRQWIEQVLGKGKSILVIGGCTLNSCVRVSAIETRKFFKRKNLRVITDLSISGARIGNYRRSDMFGGLSSVESAIREMIESGVEVVRSIDYYD